MLKFQIQFLHRRFSKNDSRLELIKTTQSFLSYCVSGDVYLHIYKAYAMSVPKIYNGYTRLYLDVDSPSNRYLIYFCYLLASRRIHFSESQNPVSTAKHLLMSI